VDELLVYIGRFRVFEVGQLLVVQRRLYNEARAFLFGTLREIIVFADNILVQVVYFLHVLLGETQAVDDIFAG
jgi:hypothetical protein